MRRMVIATLLGLLMVLSLGGSAVFATGPPFAVVVAPGEGAFLASGGSGQPIVLVLHPRGGILQPPPPQPPGQ